MQLAMYEFFLNGIFINGVPKYKPRDVCVEGSTELIKT